MTRAAVLSPVALEGDSGSSPVLGGQRRRPAAASVWREGDLMDLGLFAYVVGSLAIGAQSIGQEYTYRTLPILLSQPADRRRLYRLNSASRR